MSGVGLALGLGAGAVVVGLVVANRKKPSKAAPSDTTDTTPAEDSSSIEPELPNLRPSQTREPITTPLWVPQTAEDLEALLSIMCRCLDASPGVSDDVLAKCTWVTHWRLPNPGQPIEGDHPTVKQALESLHFAVVAARQGMCDRLPDRDDAPIITDPVIIDPVPADGPEHGELPDVEPDTPVEPGPTPSVSIDMAALTRYDPTPGYFYQVRQGDTFLGDLGIVRQALYRATLAAAQSKGWSVDKAQSRAAALAADAKARVAYLNVIQCAAWNDALYGTWGYGKSAMPSSHGRAIRLIAKHDRVYDRLADGQSPVRTIALGVPADKGTGSATGIGSAYELLWLPPLRADALLDVNRVKQVVADGMIWPDGSSKYNPPPAVQALGIEHVPAGTWGCAA